VRRAVDGARCRGENRRPVTARRPLAAAVAALWLSPIALACGVSLHVALDHHDHGEPAAPFAATVALAGEAVVGPDGHQHRIEGDTPPALRAARALVAPPAAGELLTVDGAPVAGTAVAAAAAAPPPPRAGPARLALLSTLRI